MNRKIKYVFFLVCFMTLNIAILLIAVFGCIAISEYAYSRIDTLPYDRYLASMLGLLTGAAISVWLYFRLYHYAESKWYIHRIFDSHGQDPEQ